MVTRRFACELTEDHSLYNCKLLKGVGGQGARSGMRGAGGEGGGDSQLA